MASPAYSCRRSDWNLPLVRTFLDLSRPYAQALEETQISLRPESVVKAATDGLPVNRPEQDVVPVSVYGRGLCKPTGAGSWSSKREHAAIFVQ